MMRKKLGHFIDSENRIPDCHYWKIFHVFLNFALRTRQASGIALVTIIHYEGKPLNTKFIHDNDNGNWSTFGTMHGISI